MRNLLLFVALIVSAGSYVYFKQPALWNQMLKLGSGKLPANLPFIAPSSTPQPNITPPESTPPSAPEFINPTTTTFTSTDHVKDVPQDAPAGPQKIFNPPATLPAQPDWTWTSTDGHIYKNVVVAKVEADCVTILDDDGGARVDIGTLPPDIQKQLNYDPELAAQAAAERQKQEQAAQSALLLEKQKQQANSISEETNDAAIVNDSTSKQAAADAAARVLQAQSELAIWEDDLKITRPHVANNPLTGLPSGDAYWLSKYQEDNDNITQLNVIIRSGGKK